MAGPLKTSGRVPGALIKAAVTVSVLAALFTFLPRDVLIGALRQLSPALFTVALLGLAIGHVVAAQKWRLLLRACGADCTPVEALQAHGAGLFANLCLPSLVGGDVVRAAFVSGGGRSLTPIAVGSLADRIIDTAGLLVLVGVGALFVPEELPEATMPVLFVGAIGAVVATLGLPRLVRGWPPERVPARARGLFEKLKAAVAGLEAHPGTTLWAALLSIAVQAGFVLVNAGLGKAVGIEVSVAAWFVAWPLAKLIALLPISLGGIGVREAALAGLLAGLGVEPALAVAEGLLWEAALIALGLLSGAAAFGSRRLLQRRLEPEAGEETG